MLAANITTDNCRAYISFRSKELAEFNFDLLIDCGFGWKEAHDQKIPEYALYSGEAKNGGKLNYGHGSTKALLFEHNWVKPTSPSMEGIRIPDNVVVGGYDIDDAPIYVGRALHDDVMLPAKVLLSRGCALVGWDKCEYVKSEFDMLVGQGYDWVKCADLVANVPSNAVSTGKTRSGEPLYIGRGYHRVGNKETFCIGRIQWSDRCLYIPFGYGEERLKAYQVLIYKGDQQSIAFRHTPIRTVPTDLSSNHSLGDLAKLTWMHSTSPLTIPPNAVLGGYDIDGDKIYVGRAFHDGVILPAKVIPNKGCAYVGWNMREYKKFHFEMLVGQGYDWVKCSDGYVPPNAVSTGKTLSGEPLYVGRGSFAGSLCVGKMQPSHCFLFIPFGLKEEQLNPYQVLIYKDQDTPPGLIHHSAPSLPP